MALREAAATLTKRPSKLSTFDFALASRAAIADFLAEAALLAGPAVMDLYGGRIAVRSKHDGSPVTLADQRAEEIICGRLAAAQNAPPIVAEEAAARQKDGRVGARFLLIDPLDGTKEFISGNGEFTINVAMIESGEPVAGAVYAPALGRLWVGGDEAFVSDAPVGASFPECIPRRCVRSRAAPSRLVALVSRSHGDRETEAYLARLPIEERRQKGSSLKFCELAEGAADVYPRFGPTMEWDTAAGDAVLRAAGGVVLDPSGNPLVYGRGADGHRNGPFVAWGDKNAALLVGC